MGLTKEERKNFKDKLLEDCVKNGRRFYNTLSELMGDEKYFGKVTKEEALEIAKEVIPEAGEDYIKEINSALPELNLQKFSSREVRTRKELSRKALNAIVSVTHDRFSADAEIKNAVNTGELSQNDIDTVKGKSRDIIRLLTTGTLSDGRDQDNIDLIKMASGKGLDPDDPESADMRQQMAARIWNERLQEMSEFDYDKYVNFSDEELVDNWPTAYEAFQKVFAFRKEMKTIRENPYVDTALVEKTAAIESKYTSQAGLLSQRMRCIASPYYSSIDYNKFKDIDSNAILELAEDCDDGLLKEYISAANDVKQSVGMGLGDVIEETLSNQEFIIKDNQRLFDKNGAALTPTGIIDCARRGENIYACDLSDPKEILTLKLDEKRFKCTKTEEELPDEIRQNVQNGINKAGEKHCAKYFNHLYSQGVSGNRGAQDLVKEIINKNLDYGKIKESVLAHYRGEDKNDAGLSKTEYLTRLRKQGLNPKELSAEETEARKQLTVYSHEKNLDVLYDFEKACDISEEGKAKMATLPINVRSLCYFCFKPKPEDIAYNESVIERLCGTPKQQEQVVEEIYKRHFEKLDMFGKAYTDRELIDNWPELYNTGIAVGMELENFKSFIKEKKIDVSDELKNQMEEASDFVNSSFLYYKARMEVIGTRYFQYGGEDAIKNYKQAENILDDLKDPEMQKAGVAYMTLIRQTDFTIGYGLFEDKGLKAALKTKPVAAYDGKGKKYDIYDYPAVGQALKNGGSLYLVDADNNLHPVEADMSGGIPPKYSQSPQIKENDKKCIELSQEKDRIKEGAQNKYEKKIAIDSIEKHIELLNVLKEPEKPNFDEKLRAAAADLCTSLALNKMVSGKNLPEDILKGLSSEETFKRFKNDIVSSELADRMAEVIKNNPDKIPGLSSDSLFKTMTQIQVNQKNEKIRVDAAQKQKQYLEFRKESLKRSETINETYRWAETVNTNEYFFNNKVNDADLQVLHESTPLKGMTLTRDSLKSLTVAMMLNQGYKPEQIFSPDFASDRELVANGAIAMIRAGDHETVRENLYKGLNTLNNYVSDKLDSMKDFSLSELVKPQNRMLLAVNRYLKDMNQEFDNCQNHLPKNQRLNVQSTLAIQQRAENLGFALSKMDSKYVADSAGYEEIKEAVKHYVGGELYNRYVSNIMSLPENQGKGVGKILENFPKDDFMSAYANASPDIILDGSLADKPETLRKIYDSIQDDTFRENLNIEITLPNAENRESEFALNLDNAVNKADKRELVDKAIDPSLNAPEKRKDSLVMN